MAKGLLSLLQQAANQTGAGRVPITNVPPDPEAPVQGNPITVSRNAASGGAEPPLMANENYLLEAQAAAAEAPQRSGMFGVKGTLRDILGMVGDAFLVQSGNAPIYAPRRQQERMSDALGGFTDDPVAAVERLANINPEAAQQLYVQVENQRRLQEQMEQQARIAAATAEQQAANANNSRVQDYIKVFGQAAAGVTAQNYRQIRPVLEQIKLLGGLPDGFSVPEEFNEEAQELMRFYQQVATTTGQQNTAAQNEQRIAISREQAATARMNAETNRQRANRPPASSSRAETSDERFIRLGNKPDSELTAGEREWLESRRNRGTTRAANRLRQRTAPTTTRPSVSNW